MNPENAIEVRHVSKSFKIYKDRGNMLRQRFVNHRRGQYTRREVLHDISFDIRRGETVGLIGANGCGKSTTLKMLTKILRPNAGTIETRGKVYSMIELGAGFHPDMTGRENIYINASIFGITRKEVDKRLDDIIRFSELEKFIDSPVRTYSSGMYLRLAFSVAINVDADILLIDEILAVGDQNFQGKCLKRLHELQEEGVTIVLVSHSMDQVKSFCDRAIWLKDGAVEEDGPSLKVCEDYEAAQNQKSKKRQEDEIAQQREKQLLLERAKTVIPQCDPQVTQGGKRQVCFTNVRLLDREGSPAQTFYQGDTARVQLSFALSSASIPAAKTTVDAESLGTPMPAEPLTKLSEKGDATARTAEKTETSAAPPVIRVSNITVEIIRKDWLLCYGNATKTYFQSEAVLDEQGRGEVEDVLEHLSLLPGSYHLNVCLYDQHEEVQDFYNYCIEFVIAQTQSVQAWDQIGIVSMPHYWIDKNRSDQAGR